MRQYPVKKKNALGHTVISSFDLGIGKPLTTTDPNNQTTTYKYDVLGRLNKIIGPLDSTTYPGVIYTYNTSAFPASMVTTKRMVAKTTSTFIAYSFYNGLGRVIQTKTPAENTSQQTVSGVVKFDGQGRVKEKYLPYFVANSASYAVPTYTQPKITYNYDCLGRLIKTTNPDATFSTVAYSDGIVTYTDENGHIKKSYLDAYGRVVQVDETNQGQIYTTRYTYDTLGNVIEIVDAQGNSSKFTYDSLGRKLKAEDPDMGVWNYTYDKAGNLIRQRDARNQMIDFQYDALNRLLLKRTILPKSEVLATYQYDSLVKTYCIGRLSTVTDKSGTADYYYDNLGRQIKSIKTVNSGSFTVEQTYDALDRVTSLKYPDGEIVKYTYNTSGALDKVAGTVTYLSNIDYSPTGQISKIAYGNGVSTDYAYDPQNLRLTNLVTQAPTARIQDLSYHFDNTGNITNIIDSVNSANSQDFLYDDLNRLIQGRGSYGTFGYTYDSIGNMTYKENIGMSYGEGAVARPHALTSTSDGSVFTYDNNGNLAEETPGSGLGAKYYYDAENRLSRVEPKRQQVSFSLNLKPGWNFVSLPLVPADTNILQVLKSLRFGTDYDQVARYNPDTKTWEFFVNQPDFDKFWTIEYGRGYQIYVNNPSGATLTISGYLSVNELSVALSIGWNLVGFSYWNLSMPIAGALSPLTLGTHYNTVEHYNPSTLTLEKYTSTLKQFTEMKQGEGYYVNALKTSVIKVPKQDTSGATAEPVEFVYDASGARVKKTTASGTTLYIGNLFEKLPDGTTRKHVYAGSQRICTKTYTTSPTTYNLYYYHPDHLGSSNVITDKTGNQVQLAEYTPYGGLAALSPAGTAPINYLFNGKELDKTGLYYYGARYYHPGIAHFTQPDPIIQDVYDPQNLNHYAYCRNNPLNLIDPTGMSWNSWATGFGTAWNNFWGGIGNGWNNVLSSIGSGFSIGISTLGNWGIQLTNSWSAGLRSAWNETKVWGSALGIGIDYGANRWGQGLTELTRSYQDIFKTVTTYGLDLFDNTKTPKLKIGYNLIPGTPVIHTYLQVTGMPGYNGIWEFNPKGGFSSGILLGTSVPGDIAFSDKSRWAFPLVTVTKDPTIIKQVYNIAQQSRNSPYPNYTLYGPNTYNCYTWRNEIFGETSFSIEPWGGG
jgi:RHS repeat-associated protein